MYAVVGCSDCSALWVIEGRPDTTQCPRCGTRHAADKLKRFTETDDRDHAREVRASMLANRQGEGDAFADLDSFSTMEAAVDEAGVDDEEYLDAGGVDPEAAREAGERASEGAGGSTSKRETVREALRALDRPTEDDVVAYAAERGVEADYVRRALTKLVRRGEVSEDRGEYRLL